MKAVSINLLMACTFLLLSCSKEIIEPELFGSIKGTVVDSKTNEGIGNVSIETTPATEAIVTDNKGNFELRNVATGSYLIKASKSSYNSKSINVLVREDKTTMASIVLEGDDNSTQFLQAEVTSWHQNGAIDSSQVQVEYQVRNTSSTTTFSSYEVYFDIFSNREKLLFEVADTTLSPGEINIGAFTRDVFGATVDSVVVSGTWVKKG